jgi:hypothetical protein
VPEALRRLEHEVEVARRENQVLLKIVHGYGSTGKGGDIRIAVQKRLREFLDSGQIRECIFGEDWRKSADEVWRLLQGNPDLKSDSDLGRVNRGITVVVL